MGFNSQDSAALQRARNNHFQPVVVDVSNNQCSVVRFEVGNVVGIDNPGQTLANALMAAERFFNQGSSTTVWLDVTSVELPVFVIDAVERCAGFGLGLIVTQGARCTHPPGELLPEALRIPVSKATRSGQVWHPLAQALVFTDPIVR